MKAKARLRKSSRGFSLIEVLIALAIMSIIAGLIFSSLASQVTQADAVRRSTRNAFEAVTSRRLAEMVVSRTIPAWSDEENAQFTGSSNEVRGITAAGIFSASEGLHPYRLSLVPDGSNARLQIEISGRSWQTLRFPAGARFKFMGASGTWRDDWPAPPPSATALVDLERELMDVGLPLLVSVWDVSSEKQLGLELRLENSGMLPARARDLVSDAAP